MPDKQKIKNLFNDIAPEYDTLNHVLSLDVDKLWRREALGEIVSKEKTLKVLDVACGTCDFSIAIAQHLQKGSSVMGIDLSERMLEIGKEKVREKGLSEVISLQIGDAEKLPFPDNSFDRVTVAFGVRNFENLRAGLKEMSRVLKTDGKVVILELSVPQNRLTRWFYELYFTKVLPFIGGRVSGNKGAYKYLPASVIAFPRPKEFMEIMKNCNFTKVRHRAFSLGLCRMFTADKFV